MTDRDLTDMSTRGVREYLSRPGTSDHSWSSAEYMAKDARLVRRGTERRRRARHRMVLLVVLGLLALMCAGLAIVVPNGWPFVALCLMVLLLIGGISESEVR